MKAIISVITLSIGLLVAATSAQAENLKNTYCERQTFFGREAAHDGDGGTYPHLHCHSNWIVYSPNNNNGHRIDFLDGGGLSVSKARIACERARAKLSGRIAAKITEICVDYEADCGC